MRLRILFLFSISLFVTSVGFGQKMNTTDESLNAGKVEFVQRQINTGEIPQGVPAVREFQIKNISKDVLILTDVRSGCHCVSVDWTKSPIPPGETGVVKATFDAVQEGGFYKIMTVKTNFDSKQPVAITLIGTVKPK
jgi:hypothetical protein